MSTTKFFETVYRDSGKTFRQYRTKSLTPHHAVLRDHYNGRTYECEHMPETIFCYDRVREIKTDPAR